MGYEVQMARRAERGLSRLTPRDRERVIARIGYLSDNPRPSGIKKLSNWEDYSLRVGDYRVLYTVDDRNSTVLISSVRHRREAYR